MLIEDKCLGSDYPKSPNWSHRAIKVDGVVKYTITAPISRFMDIMTGMQPASQEDWKAIYWMYGGEKPSEIEKVVVHLDRINSRGYMWGILKDGVQSK